MRIQHSAIAQDDTKMSFQVGVKVKPKVPHKPSHLVKSLRKTASFDQQAITSTPPNFDRKPSASSSIDGTEAEQRVHCYEDLEFDRNTYTPPTTPRPSHQRRKSSHAVLLTRPFGDKPHLRSPSTASMEETRDESRDTIYEEADYVQINYPQVEPGTMIRSAGKLKKAEIVRPSTPPEEDPKTSLSIRSISGDLTTKNGFHSERGFHSHRHHALVQELQDNFRSNSLDSIMMSQKKENKNVDENGYEIPLALKMPTYMLFDSDVMSSSADETDAIEDTSRNNSVISKSKKKRRLARYKRQENSKPTPTTALTSNLSKKFVLKFSSTRLNGRQDVCSQPLPELPTSRVHTPTKSIPSFLSERLKQSKSDSNLGALSVSLKSDAAISYPCPYSSSDDESDWSDSSGCSSYCDDSSCYYQQIDPPNLSGHTSDHDYEVIEDCLGYSHKSQSSVSRKKSMKSVMASVVTGRKRDKRTKSSESNKSSSELGISPKLQRKNMHDMRSTSVANCTWETVSTPGILKLNDFKEFGRNKTTSGIISAQAR